MPSEGYVPRACAAAAPPTDTCPPTACRERSADRPHCAGGAACAGSWQGCGPLSSGTVARGRSASVSRRSPAVPKFSRLCWQNGQRGPRRGRRGRLEQANGGAGGATRGASLHVAGGGKRAQEPHHAASRHGRRRPRCGEGRGPDASRRASQAGGQRRASSAANNLPAERWRCNSPRRQGTRGSTRSRRGVWGKWRGRRGEGGRQRWPC